MQKLKNSNIARMIDAKLTSKEIDFLIYVSRFQDSSGTAYGIHYKELCETMHMSHQEFYNAKASLEEKGFIQCGKSHRTDHDITIIDNHEADCLRDGYVNTNHNIFYQDVFIQMKAGTKLLALEMMKITYAGKGYFEIGVTYFYEKYRKLFGVSKRVLRFYLMELKTFFSIGIKNKKYYIEPRKRIYRKEQEQTEADRMRQHLAEAILRRNRIKETENAEKRDFKELFAQYGKIQTGKLFSCLEWAIERSLEILNEGEKRIKKRILRAPLVHKLLLEEMERERERGTGRKYDYEELERMLLTAPVMS